MTDTEKLACHLQQDFPNVTPSSDRAWSREPALRVIDCVLSLRRNYDRFVVPRLDRFELRFPQTTSVRALRGLIDGYAQPEDFLRQTLDYRDADRARILDEVTDRALEFADASAGMSELERLERWACQARPDGYTERRV